MNKPAFTQARHYTRGRPGPVTAVTIHTAECAEVASAAENLAAWTAGPQASQASWHYAVDSDSVTQSVLEGDTAWHAGPANGWAIGVELAGKAGQGADGWKDDFSQAVLARAAELVADICKRRGIPVEKLSVEDLKAGKRAGIFGHVDVTNALTKGVGHQDPGPAFPWSDFLERVKAHLEPIELGAREGEWVRVEILDQAWLVAPTYLAPVGIAEALLLAKANGCELPTPALVDVIWAAADLKLSPLPRKTDGTPRTMASADVYADQARRIADQIAGRKFSLLAGTHKDVVLKDGMVGLYGWHKPDGSVIQPFYAGHAPAWKDYSQGLRLVKRVA